MQFALFGARASVSLRVHGPVCGAAECWCVLVRAGACQGACVLVRVRVRVRVRVKGACRCCWSELTVPGLA